MERILVSDRTREQLRALIAGRAEVEDARSEPVQLAARLLIEEALEEERTTPRLLRPRGHAWGWLSQRVSEGADEEQSDSPHGPALRWRSG